MEKNFYKQVRKNIEKIREQGEPPRTDLTSFDSMDRYVCDLCKASVERSGLFQCTFCGRWVCRDGCFHADDVACLNCHGVIKLLRESSRMKAVERRRDVLLDERREALREDRRLRKKMDRMDIKLREDELEYRRNLGKAEHEKRLDELKSESREDEGGGGLLKAIRKMKKMKDSDH